MNMVTNTRRKRRRLSQSNERVEETQFKMSEQVLPFTTVVLQSLLIGKTVTTTDVMYKTFVKQMLKKCQKISDAKWTQEVSSSFSTIV